MLRRRRPRFKGVSYIPLEDIGEDEECPEQPSVSEQRAYTSKRQDTVHLKLVMIGDTAVGKTSLGLRYVKDRFDETKRSTIAASYLTHTLDFGKTRVIYEIWDTAGQERFHSLAQIYYRGAQAVVVVYDISSKTSFEHAKRWVWEVQQKTHTDIVIALVGNKADLAGKREVDYELAQAFAEKNSLLCMECSAKTAMNVDEIFLTIARRLTESSLKKRSMNDNRGVLVDITVESPKSRDCCCSCM